ncbi:MAG TPA: amidohydrolase [Steroidobacteraceae bacterium]|nr:amidohydrolase [Steroidobacteraceae bacterium]
MLLAASFIAQICSVSAREIAPADTVLVNGQLITVDPNDRLAQALAIRQGKIIRVGTDREVRRLIGPKTTVIDLHERAATPGLIDAHAHVLNTGLVELFEIDLSHAASIAEITAALAKRVAKARVGEWVVGSGWDEGKLLERRYPTAEELDAAAPGNPVWLENGTGHYGVANSVALTLAGIDAKSAAPPAGTIEHNADGKPTGVLKETAAALVTRLIPDTTYEQRREAIKHMLHRLHAEGMTGFKDPNILQSDWPAYRSLAAEGVLDANVCVLFATGTTMDEAGETLRWIRAAQHDVAALPHTSLRVCGAKIFMDGSGAAPTAWMYQEWNRNRTEVAVGNRGYPQIDPVIFRQQVHLFVDADVGIGVHAIGDRAIDWVVDSFAEALTKHPRNGLRLSIIHANTPTDHAIRVMAELQKRYDSGIPESQAGFTWWIGDIYAANLGPERSLRLNPFQSYLQQGVIWAGGSDSPVTPIEARYGLWASIARETLKGTFGKTPFGTQQAVDIHAALRSYTAWAARQISADQDAGSLEVGKSADIAVWDRNPYTIPTAALKDMVCDMTIFRGRIVFRRNQNAAQN